MLATLVKTVADLPLFLVLFTWPWPRYALVSTMLRKLGLVTVAAVAFGACGGEPATKLAASRPATRHSVEAKAPPLAELEPSVVARAIRGNESSLRECFAGKDGRPVRGFMRMTFRVQPSGDVEEVDVESSSFAESGVFECLSERVAALHFDARPDTRLARWTFASGIAQARERGARKKQRKARHHGDASEEGVVIDEKSRGSLSPSEVEEVVQAGFGLFAHCYREGIARHPKLSGAVRLRMVIGRDGLVDELADASSEIPDREIIDCVAEGFFALKFPKPRKGSVRLTYRILFDAS